MVQNSFFTFKRIYEQNGSLHQHKSTFVVIDHYQGLKPPFLRLVLREFKRRNGGRFEWTSLGPEFKMAPTPLTRSGFQWNLRQTRVQNKKKAVTDTQYIQQSVHTYDKLLLLNNQSTKASICPSLFYVNGFSTLPSETRCHVTSHCRGKQWRRSLPPVSTKRNHKR